MCAFLLTFVLSGMLVWRIFCVFFDVSAYQEKQGPSFKDQPVIKWMVTITIVIALAVAWVDIANIYRWKSGGDLDNEDLAKVLQFLGRDLDLDDATEFIRGQQYKAAVAAASRVIMNSLAEDPSLTGSSNRRDGYLVRAHANHKMGKWQEAIADYNTAMTLSGALKDSLFCMHRRADVYRDMGAYESAIDDYTHVISRGLYNEYDVLLTMVYYGRGRAYEYLGEEITAISDYSDALRKVIGYPGLYSGRLFSYSPEPNTEDCIVTDIYHRRGRLYLKQKNKGSAVQDLIQFMNRCKTTCQGSVCRDFEDLLGNERYTDLNKILVMGFDTTTFLTATLEGVRVKTDSKRSGIGRWWLCGLGWSGVAASVVIFFVWRRRKSAYN